MIKRIYRVISSMRFGLALMGVCAAVLAVGTVIIPDRISETWIFRVLLLLMTANMAACTINQIVSLIQNRGRSGILRRFALIALHGGIVLVILGGGWNAIRGITEGKYIAPGDTMEFAQSGCTVTLNAFEIMHDVDGRIEQYQADITAVQEGYSASMAVTPNNPGTFREYKIYYGEYVDGYTVEILRSDGELERIECVEGDSIALGDDHFIQIIANEDAERIYHRLDDTPSGESLTGELNLWYETSAGIFYRFLDIQEYVSIIVKTSPGNILAAIGAVCTALGALAVFIAKADKKRL